MISENVTAIGRLTVTLVKAGGEMLLMELDNLIVTTGKNFIASRVAGNVASTMSHMAIGTGTTAPAISDTSLQAEAARVALGGATAAGAVVTYQATFGAGVGTGAIAEAGIFNGSNGGTMLNRVQFPVVNKGVSDSLTITWQVTIQ